MEYSSLTVPRHSLVAGFVIAVSWCVVSSSFLFIRFESNDDTAMMLLSSGVYSGTPSEYLVFINYYLGLILKWMYFAVPWVNWYAYLQLAMLSASLAFITADLLGKGKESWVVRLVFSAICILLFLICTVQLQFTTTAAISAVAGTWQFLRSRTNLSRFLAGTLIILGLLLRFEAAALAIAVSAPSLIAYCFGKPELGRRSLFLVAVICVGVLLIFLGEMGYRTLDPEYYAFNELRGFINDNPFSEIPAGALPDGVSQNDYRLLLAFFPDRSVLGISDLQKIAEAVRESQSNIDLEQVFGAALDVVGRREVLVTLLLLGIFAFFAERRLLGVAIAVSGGLLLALLSYVEAFAILKQRVVLAGLSGAILSLSFSRPALRWKSATLVVLLGSYLAYQLFWGLMWRLENNDRSSKLFQSQVDVLRNWDGDIFVFSYYLTIEGAGAFGHGLDALSGRLRFSGWLVGHPQNPEFSTHDSVLREGVAVLVSSDSVEEISRMILKSLLENYGVRASSRIISEGNGISLLEFSLAEPDVVHVSP